MKTLVKQFKMFDTRRLSLYDELLSSKWDGEKFPPYIPHVGENYQKFRIMMYATAQSMTEPWAELKDKNHEERICQLKDAGDYGQIWIAPYKVMVALAGLYIYAVQSCRLETFEEVHKHIAVSNYYKFSFSNKGRDINPNTGLPRFFSPDTYWALNDELSKLELDTLKPEIIISFNGRQIQVMRKDGFKVLNINDPAWVLRGGSGVLKPTGSWYQEISDSGVNKLIDSYLGQIDEQYSGKKVALKIYLHKYYNDWKKG